MLMVLKQCVEQGELIQWFYQQRTNHPNATLFGVVLPDDTLIALDSDHNAGPYHSFRETFGEKAWELCHYPNSISVSGYSTDPPVPRSSRNVKWRGEAIGRKARQRRRLRTVTHKAREFIAAITGDRVNDIVFKERLTTCSRNPCGKLIQREGKLYCGACGCGEWKLAELHRKLRFAHLSCPFNHWEKYSGK